METKSIVVAVDGSESSGKAVRAAARLADATGRDLKLLYVHPIPGGYTPVLIKALGRPELERLRVQAARDVFDNALAHMSQRPQPPEEIRLWGEPADEIIEYLKENPNTHLVMGKRGLSKISKLLLGSISDKVVRHAPGLITVVGD